VTCKVADDGVEPEVSADGDEAAVDATVTGAADVPTVVLDEAALVTALGAVVDADGAEELEDDEQAATATPRAATATNAPRRCCNQPMCSPIRAADRLLGSCTCVVRQPARRPPKLFALRKKTVRFA
jgi:hypothetical protein